MVFRSAGVPPAHDHERAGRPRSDDYSAATAVLSFAVSASSTLKSAVSATP